MDEKGQHTKFLENPGNKTTEVITRRRALQLARLKKERMKYAGNLK